MRVIKRSRIGEYAKAYPKAAVALWVWHKNAKIARWGYLQDVRRQYPSADAVTVKSGRTATVFNINGNTYRLIVAIHYNWKRVFILRFLTHSDYSRNKWKDEL